MVTEKRYQVWWNVYCAQAAVKRRVGDGADDRVSCSLDYGSNDVQIRCKGKTFIIRLTTFNLLDLRSSLNCELPIRIF